MNDKSRKEASAKAKAGDPERMPGRYRVGADAEDAAESPSDRDAPEYYSKDRRPKVGTPRPGDREAK